MNAWRSLAPKQYACAMLLREGLEDSEIAARLGVALSTVKKHLSQAYNNSGARNRVQLALMAERGELKTKQEAA